MSLLTIVDNVSRELKLGSVMTVIGNTNRNVQNLRALAAREGKHLVVRKSFEALAREASHVTLAQEDQGDIDVIAPGFQRVAAETAWNRTERRRLIGPISAEEWQERKSRDLSSFNPLFRLRGGRFLMFPAPPAGQDVYFEYFSKYWVKAADQTLKPDFTQDTDVSLIDENIIELGVLWRQMESDGLDYAEKKRDYEVALKNVALNDAPERLVIGQGSRTDRGDYRAVPAA